jgi:hypothetical protein
MRGAGSLGHVAVSSLQRSELQHRLALETAQLLDGPVHALVVEELRIAGPEGVEWRWETRHPRIGHRV